MKRAVFRAVMSQLKSQMFRRNILPPSAGKQEAGKNLLAMSFWFLAWLTL
jgi:hypothetical protein